MCPILPEAINLKLPPSWYIGSQQDLIAALQPSALDRAAAATASLLLAEPLIMADSGFGSGSPTPTPPPPPAHSCIFPFSSWEESMMMQALNIARDSIEGASEPTVCSILESAIEKIWAKILAYPNRYIMTRNEFAVFNYFQARFRGNEVAVAARRRYWDNTYGP